MDSTYTASPAGGKPSRISPTQLAAALSAVLLIGASATFGAHYAWSQGVQHGRLMALAGVAFALGLELAKPLAVAGMIEASKRWDFGRAALLAVLATVAILYSLTAELQLMAKSRADSVAARMGQSQATADARHAREEVRRDLEALGKTRTEAELVPLLTAARRTAGDCARIYTVSQRDACRQLPQLESEAARGARAAELQGRLRAADEAIDKAGHSRQADPGTAALASFLAALGVTVPADRLGDWLVLVGVLALEVGSALAGLLVQPVQRPEVPPAIEPVHTGLSAPVHSPVQSPAAQPRPAMPAPTVIGAAAAQPCPAPTESARERVLAIVRAAGGTVQSGQRALAVRAGVSPTRLRQVLDGLSADGLVRVRAGTAGTVISVAAS